MTLRLDPITERRLRRLAEPLPSVRVLLSLALDAYLIEQARAKTSHAPQLQLAQAEREWQASYAAALRGEW